MNKLSRVRKIFLSSMGPTVLMGDEARAFEVWLNAGPTPEALEAARATASNGHRLLRGAPIVLPSGHVLRYGGPASRKPKAGT